MQKKLKYHLSIICLIIFSSIKATESPFIVFDVSQGTILYSSVFGEIINPVRGTEVYLKDTFELKDGRFYVDIKDSKNGEIFSFKGKGKLTPREIVNKQKYSLWEKFTSYVKFQGSVMGFNTSPVYTSQCVLYKGSESPVKSELSKRSKELASQIRNAISNREANSHEVSIRRVFSDEKTSYTYSIDNKAINDYGLRLYTISKAGEISKHDLILIQDEGRIIPDEIEYIWLPRQSNLDLTYFNLSADVNDSQTCYVLLFNPKDLYPEYNCMVDWEILEQELKYQGNRDFILRLR